MANWIPGAASLDPDEPCALCGSKSKRQLSHLVPKFVFQHASTRPPTGFLRTNVNPNRRNQDGPKEYLLCRDCEQRFSRWERPFSRLFKSQHEKPAQTFEYGANEALCALSIAWRVLAHQRAHPELNHLTFGNDYSRTDEAIAVWSDVLLGKLDHPGKFRLNWLWLNYITNGPPEINRYIFHACDFDVWASDSRSFSVAHLPGVFIVGALEESPRSEFRGFDVSFKGGRYHGHGNKQAPVWLKHYIDQKMQLRKAAIDGLSPAQKAKIAQTVLADPEKALRSPLFRAIMYDRAANPHDD
jgi:hypothetical protein